MAFVYPKESVLQLGKIEGMTVADFGAGIGTYTMVCAQKVGEKGRVYAIEVQKNLLSKVKNTAVERGFGNVEVLWGDIERSGGTKLADGSVDVVVAANVLFQVEDKIGFVTEVKRVLKSKGRVLLVDWRDSYGGLGPVPEAVVCPDDARSYFEQEGFAVDTMFDAGDRHYGFVMSK